jgi:DNA-directed RNA polymerase subunit F
MAEEEKFIDFATVRDMLLSAQDRRNALTYEQKAALQHAEWAASDNRNGYPTTPEVFESLRVALVETEVLSDHPALAAKLAELMPMYPDDVKAVLASRRITVDDNDIDTILEIVRQQIGFE